MFGFLVIRSAIKVEIHVIEKGGLRLLMILIVIILFVYLFDFTKLRRQNETIIEQNEKMISLLEEIKHKSS